MYGSDGHFFYYEVVLGIFCLRQIWPIETKKKLGMKTFQMLLLVTYLKYSVVERIVESRHDIFVDWQFILKLINTPSSPRQDWQTRCNFWCSESSPTNRTTIPFLTLCWKMYVNLIDSRSGLVIADKKYWIVNGALAEFQRVFAFYIYVYREQIYV